MQKKDRDQSSELLNEPDEKPNSFFLKDPYTVPYKGMYVVCDEKNERSELIEHSECYAGACWSLYHYSKSPIIKESRFLGETVRYTIDIGQKPLELKSSVSAAGIESLTVDPEKNEVEVTLSGLGGGGIGATKCRALARGVLRYEITESGGGKTASGRIYIPRRSRVLIAIDDTDSCEVGATWTLTHNIAQKVMNNDSVLLSQALVQLFPVPERTQNCMSTVLEFGCVSETAKKDLVFKIKKYLEKYSASENTGMLVYTGFYVPDALKEYSLCARTKRLTKEEALKTILENNVEIILNGNGVIGALGAFAGYAQPTETVIPKFKF